MFLKNKNIVFKIRRSKVTDYAALNLYCYMDAKYHLVIPRVAIRYLNVCRKVDTTKPSLVKMAKYGQLEI